MADGQRANLTATELRGLISYDPLSGQFTWLPRSGADRFTRTWNTRYAGKLAGYNSPDGYWYVTIHGVSYLAHRLAWLYMNGRWPTQIDHKNLDRSDTRWENLRESTQSQNLGNAPKRRNNTSGYKGVFFCRATKKWNVQIKVNGKRICGKRWESIEDARAQYAALAQQHFGEFARP